MIVWLPGMSVGQTDIESVGTFGPAQLMFDGFLFTEGPTDDGQGNLYFTDIPANRIYQVTDGKKSVFVEPSLHCDGLMIDGVGQLLACQMDGQHVAYDVASGTSRVLAGKYQGKRFNACNDLVVDRQGGVYFTDPHYRAPDPLPQGRPHFITAPPTVR
ncbi:MAG: SMP-30/gluconolactonase/LRE family protein [Planctomycetaceae bacterium]|nr:SMP-30/gluconolactonase/LRE family protein [Planctomycetaceae bacterium]